MENQKDTAIAIYVQERKEAAKDQFQSEVNSVLAEISGLSRQLKAAKERLMALEYKEPEDLEI